MKSVPVAACRGSADVSAWEWPDAWEWTAQPKLVIASTARRKATRARRAGPVAVPRNLSGWNDTVPPCGAFLAQDCGKGPGIDHSEMPPTALFDVRRPYGYGRPDFHRPHRMSSPLGQSGFDGAVIQQEVRPCVLDPQDACRSRTRQESIGRPADGRSGMAWHLTSESDFARGARAGHLKGSALLGLYRHAFLTRMRSAFSVMRLVRLVEKPGCAPGSADGIGGPVT